ncbi:MAG: hypothetical protein ACLP00_12255 [Terracidiphilus sp.]
MAGCIENLLTQLVGDFHGFKDFNRAPLEDRVQDVVHGSTSCCHYNTQMLQTQHKRPTVGDGGLATQFLVVPMFLTL